MREIVISHSKEDHDLAEAVCRVLEENGFTCWIAPRDEVGGVNYSGKIVDAIKEAKIVLVIVSKDSNQSLQVVNELESATSYHKSLLPFQIDSAEWSKDFYYYLHSHHIIDASSDPTQFFRELVESVADLLDKEIPGESVSDFRDEKYERMANYENLRKMKQEQRHAFVQSIDPDTEEEMDQYHCYEKIVRLDVVDSKKDLWSSYRFLTITNVSDQDTYFIVHKECGENKTEFKKMRIRAYMDDPNGDRLRVEPVTVVQPNFIQVFKIIFDKPLKPRETMTIFYRLEWKNEPDAYYMGELSQSISLIRYPRGVGSVEFAVFEPYPIAWSYMKEIDRYYCEKKSSSPVEYLPVQEEERLEPLHEKTLYGVKYHVEDAAGMSSYVIVYQLGDTVDGEEEDFF